MANTAIFTFRQGDKRGGVAIQSAMAKRAQKREPHSPEAVDLRDTVIRIQKKAAEVLAKVERTHAKADQAHRAAEQSHMRAIKLRRDMEARRKRRA